ncbi:hypothetical protein [Herminiimonas fonticola]|uniref:hypothetical protein n=1 Tax=Herminiimonas fonticola TaxID=303380 RepID=UPI0019D4CB4B|nr:hypothetical protein [Herminiimonas fonticola]
MVLLFLLASGAASANESISVCYNYGCTDEAAARFSEPQLRTLAKKLRSARSAAEERKALADVIGQLYYWAGQQTPVYADKGGNVADDAVNGAMDCIDHSTTTTRFLKMLERRKLLRYHEVENVVRRRRFFLFEHFSAMIEERPHPLLAKPADDGILDFWDEVKPHRYVVDSWFVNNGKPAVILPLEDWTDGAGPNLEPSRY